MRFIVLFDDNSFMIYLNKPCLADLGETAMELYEVSSQATMAELCEWDANDHKHKQFNKSEYRIRL